MPSRLFSNEGFDADEVTALVAVLESCLLQLGLKLDREDPVTKLVASQIIFFTKQGIRDPEELCAATLKKLRE